MDILGTRVDVINLEDSMQRISGALAVGHKLWIVSANPELIYKADKDKKLQTVINSADLILPDGVGVVWAARKFGAEKAERVTGIDLTQRILEESNERSWRVFLLGAKPGIAEKAISKQHREYPGIIFGCHHGYFSQEEESRVLEQIENFSPDVLLVGIGAPKQELWNAAYSGKAVVRIGVGGTIDVLSGEVRRAPKFYSDHKVEWLYRLVTEPFRFRRQIVLPLYVLKVLRKKYLSG